MPKNSGASSSRLFLAVEIYNAVTLCSLCLNLSGNFVATQVASEIAERNMPRSLQIMQLFLQETLHHVESGSTFRNDRFKAATHFLAISQCNVPETLLRPCNSNS